MPNPLDSAPPLCRLTAAQLAAAYADGSLSPVEVTRAALARAEEVNPAFNAFTLIDHQGALQAAQASESRWREKTPLSALDGVPATIKDIVAVRNWTTSYGSRTQNAPPAAEDAPAPKNWRRAGVIFIGQTTTPEFGWKAVTDSARFGVTRNPWNPNLSPGGSSGGAAAAAAAGAGVLHLGTDGGGSIRIPAAWCGIAGIKPSFGLVPAFPPSAFGTLAHIGPMARTVADLQAGLAAMCARDLRDWHQVTLPQLAPPAPCALAGLRLGVWQTPPGLPAAPETAAAFAATLANLQSAGAVLEPITLPPADLLNIFETLWFAGAAARLRAIPTPDQHLIEPALRAIAAIGESISVTSYITAHTARAAFGAAMDALLDRFDAVISPATAIPPLGAGQLLPDNAGLTHWHEWAGFSFPLNLSQQPACVIPAAAAPPEAPPFAIQLIRARGGDARLLDIAATITAALANPQDAEHFE